MSLADQNDRGCAACELRDIAAILIARHATREGVRTAVLLLDLLEASFTLWLLQHDVHLAEALL